MCKKKKQREKGGGTRERGREREKRCDAMIDGGVLVAVI